MPVVVESAAYYAAANTCYKLSTDVQAAFKPLSRVLTLETSGMAGGYQAVKAWSSGYDNRAAALTTASTEYARALQRLGDILTAAGYNWAIADWRANRDPNAQPALGRSRPNCLMGQMLSSVWHRQNTTARVLSRMCPTCTRRLSLR